MEEKINAILVESNQLRNVISRRDHNKEMHEIAYRDWAAKKAEADSLKKKADNYFDQLKKAEKEIEEIANRIQVSRNEAKNER